MNITRNVECRAWLLCQHRSNKDSQRCEDVPVWGECLGLWTWCWRDVYRDGLNLQVSSPQTFLNQWGTLLVVLDSILLRMQSGSADHSQHEDFWPLQLLKGEVRPRWSFISQDNWVFHSTRRELPRFRIHLLSKYQSILFVQHPVHGYIFCEKKTF